MNKCYFTGNLANDPETRAAQSGLTIARFSIAVARMKTKDNQNPGVDFINCVAFGSRGDFIANYFHKGDKIILEAHVQTGSYEGKNGKVYTTDFIVDNAEFGQSRNSADNSQRSNKYPSNQDFMNIPDGVDAELPFN